MALLYRSGMTMQQIGDRYGVSRQTVQQRLASIGVTADLRPPRHTQIDKECLESLYTEEKLPLSKIAEAFGVGTHVINRALEFYKISERRSIKSNGKYVDLLRKLKVGEKSEIQCHAKKPYVVLHKSANRTGRRVSVKKLERGKFQVTRIA